MRLAAGVLAACLASPALAADVAAPVYPAPPLPAPAYDWSGFYAGINAGWGSADGTMTLGRTTSTGSGVSGAIAGGQAGINFQSGATVLGIEADYQWSGQTKDIPRGILSENIGITGFATARARLGATVTPEVLLYATSGAAWLWGRDRLTVATTGLEVLSLPVSGAGWTIGGGIEAALSGRWTAKIEYLYLQANVSGNGAWSTTGLPVSGTATIHDNVVRAGLNYRF